VDFTHLTHDITRPLIELEHVSRRRRGGKIICPDDVSLKLFPGQLTWLKGGNGTGKSSLMELLALLHKPTRGKITMFGHDVYKSPWIKGGRERNNLRGGYIVYLPQKNFGLLKGSALDNVQMWLARSWPREQPIQDIASEALDQVQTSGGGFNIHTDISKLSGGEQARVAIAIAFALGYPVCLADEILADIDADSIEPLLLLFRQLQRRTRASVTIIGQFHQDFGAYFDRIITLEKYEEKGCKKSRIIDDHLVPFPVTHRTIDVPNRVKQPIVVAPDGSGAYRTLPEALDSASPGATIQLRPGKYHLEHGLLLKKPVTLVGAGSAETMLTTEHGEYVLRYDGEGLFGLQHLAVYGAITVKTVVDVLSGEVKFDHCWFSDTAPSDTGIGVGVALRHNVRGIVKECFAVKNGCGIYVGDQAQPILETNVCHGNLFYGICYSGTATGTACQNTCSRNELHGISVIEQARPVLIGNKCLENKFGITYWDTAAGTAHQNTCSHNKGSGIVVGDQAQPILETNTCLENQSADVEK
jgi:parallel beta-helix repeat protein